MGRFEDLPPCPISGSPRFLCIAAPVPAPSGQDSILLDPQATVNPLSLKELLVTVLVMTVSRPYGALRCFLTATEKGWLDLQTFSLKTPPPAFSIFITKWKRHKTPYDPSCHLKNSKTVDTCTKWYLLLSISYNKRYLSENTFFKNQC